MHCIYSISIQSSSTSPIVCILLLCISDYSDNWIFSRRRLWVERAVEFGQLWIYGHLRITCVQRIKSWTKWRMKNPNRIVQDFNPLQSRWSFQQFTLINVPYGWACFLNDNVFSSFASEALIKSDRPGQIKVQPSVFPPLALFQTGWVSF